MLRKNRAFHLLRLSDTFNEKTPFRPSSTALISRLPGGLPREIARACMLCCC